MEKETRERLIIALREGLINIPLAGDIVAKRAIQIVERVLDEEPVEEGERCTCLKTCNKHWGKGVYIPDTPTKMNVPERLSPYNGLIHGSLNATLDKINEIIDYLEATKENHEQTK